MLWFIVGIVIVFALISILGPLIMWVISGLFSLAFFALFIWFAIKFYTSPLGKGILLMLAVMILFVVVFSGGGLILIPIGLVINLFRKKD